ncbi:MAG: hypothetical protein IJ087_14740 [Eggerthellaceae bacterium]|nr:hypothetical protein [Eggerthellaceae bacterium]
MLRKVRDLIAVGPANGLLAAWGFGFKGVRPHLDFGTGEVDGQSVELVINRDAFAGYSEEGVTNYGESVTVHHIGATDRTYASFEVGTPVEVEIERVNPRCSTFFDTKRSKHVGYIADLEFYGKVKKAAK